jgi:hypothetical protein
VVCGGGGWVGQVAAARVRDWLAGYQVERAGRDQAGQLATRVWVGKAAAVVDLLVCA